MVVRVFGEPLGPAAYGGFTRPVSRRGAVLKNLAIEPKLQQPRRHPKDPRRAGNVGLAFGYGFVDDPSNPRRGGGKRQATNDRLPRPHNGVRIAAAGDEMLPAGTDAHRNASSRRRTIKLVNDSRTTI
jgi:hypothetical protein